MNEFFEKLKTDRILQIIIGGLIIAFLFLFYFIRPLFFAQHNTKSRSSLPCYQTTLKLWLPFKEFEIYPYLSNFTTFCVQFKIETKSLEEIKKDLTFALATNQYPDIVFIDNDFLNKYPDFFATATPILVDSLIAYYNQDVINFLNLEKPKTFDEIKNFILKIKNYKQNFYPIGLGTKNVRNRKEILLSLMSLDPSFKDKTRFSQNLSSAFKLYQNFSNPQSEFFSYPKEETDDLTNFANEKMAMYIGFYNDKKEILAVNPRINLAFDIYPLNTFPPKTKIYSKIFYLVPLRKSANIKVSREFISWFSKYQLKNFAQNFDFVPFVNDNSLPPEKQLVINSVKNFGETFDFLNKEVLWDNLDKLFEVSENQYELFKIIESIYYSI